MPRRMSPTTRQTAAILAACAIVATALGWAFYHYTRPMQCYENVSSARAALCSGAYPMSHLDRTCPVTGGPYMVSSAASDRLRRSGPHVDLDHPKPIVWETVPHGDGYYYVAWSDYSVRRVRKLPSDLPAGTTMAAARIGR
jgi:hypothetical protein